MNEPLIDSSTEIVLISNRFVKVWQEDVKSTTIICEICTNYIPEQNFKETFEFIADQVRYSKVRISKIVFDKRMLTTFHQGSMTWYHVEWKPKMLAYGLKTYYKILPKDAFFRKSVQIGRERITSDNPNFDWDKYDIQYFETLQEAMA